MARIFITGSADGLGQLAAKALIAKGHQVVLHARNERRGKDARDKVSGAENVVTADLSSVDETKQLAAKNALGRFDAVIHNAGVYQARQKRYSPPTHLAPHILTCLFDLPKPGMHLDGRSKLERFKTDVSITYSDSKLYVLMLCLAVARKWLEFTRTQSIPVGFLRRWAGKLHLMICKKDTRRRCGLLQETRDRPR